MVDKYPSSLAIQAVAMLYFLPSSFVESSPESTWFEKSQKIVIQHHRTTKNESPQHKADGGGGAAMPVAAVCGSLRGAVVAQYVERGARWQQR